MISGVHVEVILAISYAIFLMGMAFTLEWLARHSHQRSQRYRNAGFVYFEEMDLWECPANRQLHRTETDHKRRVVHYRAPADACNACLLKSNCTDSSEGRILKSQADPWLESELRRFHRGISLALLFLATIILISEIFRHPEFREVTLLGCLLLAVSLAEGKLFVSFLTREPQLTKTPSP